MGLQRIQDEDDLDDGTKAAQLGEGHLAQGGILKGWRGQRKRWRLPTPSLLPAILRRMGYEYLHAPRHGGLIDEQLQDVEGHGEHRQALGDARSRVQDSPALAPP